MSERHTGPSTLQKTFLSTTTFLFLLLYISARVSPIHCSDSERRRVERNLAIAQSLRRQI